jgi:hypothetical protein
MLANNTSIENKNTDTFIWHILLKQAIIISYEDSKMDVENTSNFAEEDTLAPIVSLHHSE